MPKLAVTVTVGLPVADLERTLTWRARLPAPSGGTLTPTMSSAGGSVQGEATITDKPGITIFSLSRPGRIRNRAARLLKQALLMR